MRRLLLFDIDMTLIRAVNRGQGPGRAAIDAAFAQTFGVANASAGMAFDGRTDRGIFNELISRHSVADGDGPEAYTTLVEAYLAALQETTRQVPSEVLPGVRALLDALTQTDAGVGLATGNIRRGAEIKLTRHALWTAFAGGGFGDDTDDRAVLVRAGMEALAARMGCEAAAAECIVIGDTPLDIAAARATGARALAVATGRFSVAQLQAEGADWAVEDLSDTASLVRLLAG